MKKESEYEQTGGRGRSGMTAKQLTFNDYHGGNCDFTKNAEGQGTGGESLQNYQIGVPVSAFSPERQANTQAIKVGLWRQYGGRRISSSSPEFKAAIDTAKAEKAGVKERRKRPPRSIEQVSAAQASSKPKAPGSPRSTPAAGRRKGLIAEGFAEKLIAEGAPLEGLGSRIVDAIAEQSARSVGLMEINGVITSTDSPKGNPLVVDAKKRALRYHKDSRGLSDDIDLLFTGP